MNSLQDHPWKDEQGRISAKTALRWWITTCLFMGVSATTTAATAALLAEDLERRGFP